MPPEDDNPFLFVLETGQGRQQPGTALQIRTHVMDRVVNARRQNDPRFREPGRAIQMRTRPTDNVTSTRRRNDRGHHELRNNNRVRRLHPGISLPQIGDLEDLYGFQCLP